MRFMPPAQRRPRGATLVKICFMTNRIIIILLVPSVSSLSFWYSAGGLCFDEAHNDHMLRCTVTSFVLIGNRCLHEAGVALCNSAMEL